MNFPHELQHNSTDCGPACLRNIARFYGRSISYVEICDICNVTKQGSSLLSLKKAAESIGFNAMCIKISWRDFVNSFKSPCIVCLNNNHYVVVYKIKNVLGKARISVSDPSVGLLSYNQKDFFDMWIGRISESISDYQEGIVCLIEPKPGFYGHAHKSNKRSGRTIRTIYNYFKPYKIKLCGVFVTLLVASCVNMIIPHLTQSLVDSGIKNNDLSQVVLILVAEFALVFGQAVNNIIRNLLLLHVSTKIGISYVSDFLYKLMRLPVEYFENNISGDIIQRIKDCDQIQLYVSSTLFSMLMALMTFVVYAVVIGSYNVSICCVFFVGSAIYIYWVLSFMEKRKVLDHSRFYESATSQNNVIEIVDSIHEIKLNNYEQRKQIEWELTQNKIYQIAVKRLNLAHSQEAGGLFIDQTKNLIVSFLTASAVIDEEMTFGMMVALQFIMGQLNAPIIQFIQFVQSSQDSIIAFDRIEEIKTKADEQGYEEHLLEVIPQNADLTLDNVSFRYKGVKNLALSNISITFPFGKTTAIVGKSGSGKTTLLKLLLGFYKPTTGRISIDNRDMFEYRLSEWRRSCGVIMQNGYIFSTTIKENISLEQENVDENKLEFAVRFANIKDLIDQLPQKINTKIGSNGIGLSGGQKQRLLIARAIYKDAKYLFFDEATNSLDTSNEYKITGNLHEYCKDKTLVVIAHRLSTIVNSDQIIVLDEGKIVEVGTHESLLSAKGTYFDLVKSQMFFNN